MIEVTKINGQVVWINCEQIQVVEASPDTNIIFMDGKSLLVKDTPTEVSQKYLKYRKEMAQAESKVIEIDLG